MLSEIPGPAGTLWVMLDGPAAVRLDGARGETSGRRRAARRGGVRASASSLRRHDAHQGGVSSGQGAGADRRARCCASTSAASAAAPVPSTTGRGEKEDFRAALEFMHDRYPGAAAMGGRHVVRFVDRADRRRARIRACTLLIGIAMPVDATTSARCGERQAEVLHPRRTRRADSAEAGARVLRECPASRRSSSSSTRRIICSTARLGRSPMRWKTSWVTP